MASLRSLVQDLRACGADPAKILRDHLRTYAPTLSGLAAEYVARHGTSELLHVAGALQVSPQALQDALRRHKEGSAEFYWAQGIHGPVGAVRLRG